MIDWVKCSLPLNWEKPISGGQFIRISPDGEIERVTVLSKHVRGSFDEHLTLRTVERGWVQFDGNPSKFLQGHNLFGSDDLCALVTAAMEKAFGILGLEVPAGDRDRWIAGDWDLSRVDVSYMYELGGAGVVSDVRAWLRAAATVATMKWRKPTVHGTTLYFGKVAAGKRGSAWSFKAYCKYDELCRTGKGHELHPELPWRFSLLYWSMNKLRMEVMLRGAELRRPENRRYLRAANWGETTAAEIYARYFAKMELGSNAMLTADKEHELKPAARLAYMAWKEGHDLQATLPQRTFFRYKRQLLDMTGGEVDLSCPCVSAKTNVVPLVRLLEARPVELPRILRHDPELLFQRAA